MRVSLIVAVAENGIIGRDGDLPWKLSNDLRYFKSVTMGKPIVMGRKTYESIGRPLPGRPNLVISRNPGFAADGVEVFPALDAALDHAATFDGDEVMIIGGATLYADALSFADRLYLTEVHADVDGDVSFPARDPAAWTEISRQRHSASDKDAHPHSFVVLDRVTTP